MSDISPDLSGRTLGNWTLVRLLGEGGFGAVYEAQHTTIVGRGAAVKVLHPHLAFHKDIKRRFITEASIASQADHENIVQVFDGGVSSDGTCYVAMEMLKGRSLAQYIHDEKRLDVDLTLKIAIQVVSALEAAHKLGVVHRDLKPDNIFISPRKTNAHFVKVLDFGIAKLHTQESKTATGTLLGTPIYMSPEQWQTLPDIDGRSDLYSLGVILYECLSGKPPYDGETSFVLMMAHMQKAIPDLAQLVPVPTQLGLLIKRLLAKQREDRPATARAVLNELRQLAGYPVIGPEDDEVSALTIAESGAMRTQLSPHRSPRSLSIRQQSGELVRSLLTPYRRFLPVGGSVLVLGTAALIWLLVPHQSAQPKPNGALSIESSLAPGQAQRQLAPPFDPSETHDMRSPELAAPQLHSAHPGAMTARSRRGSDSSKPQPPSSKSPPSAVKPKTEKHDTKREPDLYVVPIIR